MTGAIFSVERRRYQRPDGAEVTRDVVVHPGSVTIVPLLDYDRIVLIRNYRYLTEKELLELPAGTLEAGETPERCALRELEEETGYRAGRLDPLCEFYTTPGICTERMRVFIGTDLTATGQRLQGSERIRVAVTGIDQVRRMLDEGGIEDGKTIAALGTFFLRGEGTC
ncbi:MAG: NUDIX hydrolase [Planctomycetota bacterium]